MYHGSEAPVYYLQGGFVKFGLLICGCRTGFSELSATRFEACTVQVLLLALASACQLACFAGRILAISGRNAQEHSGLSC